MCCSIALGVLWVLLGWNQYMAILYYAYELTLGVPEVTNWTERDEEWKQKEAFPVYLDPVRKRQMGVYVPCMVSLSFCTMSHYSRG